jgi:hypothetical protein
VDLTPGCWVGDWILEAPLGQGGFGRVYRARHGTSGAVAAVKVAREAGGLRSSLALEHEHPHIVRTLEEHLEHDPPFVVLELVPDGNVRELLAREGGSLAPGRALEVVSHVAAALEHAHARGVLHLDVKPENVLVDAGRRVFKLADFGGPAHPDPTALAHSLRLTGDVRLAGTRDYAAPEVREGAGRLDRRADVYSLGVLAFELLTGRLPLGLDRPSELVATLPRALDPVLERALARTPERRTLTAGGFASELARALTPGPARSAAPDPAPRARSSHLPIGLALVVAALVGGVLYQRLRPPAWAVTPSAGVLGARTGPLLEAQPAGARVAVLAPLDLAERGEGPRARHARATLDEAVVRARRVALASGLAATVDPSALFVRAARAELSREAGCDLVLHAVLPPGDVDQARVSLIDLASWSIVATTSPGDRAAAELGRRAAAHLLARDEVRAVAVLPVLDATRGVGNRTTALLGADLAAALTLGSGGRFPVRARPGIVERLRDSAGSSAGDLRRALSVGLALEGRLDAQRGVLRVALRDLETEAVLWVAEAAVQSSALADYDVGLDMDRFTPDAAAVDRALGERLDRVLADQVEAETARALEGARRSLGDGRPDEAASTLERLRARGPAYAARLEPLLLLTSAHQARGDSPAALTALEEAMAVAPADPRPREAYADLCEALARRLFEQGKRPWWRDDDEESFRRAREVLGRLDHLELSPARRAAVERLRGQLEDEL